MLFRSRMIVEQDHARGAYQNCRSKDLASMHEQSIHRADGHQLMALHPLAATRSRPTGEGKEKERRTQRLGGAVAGLVAAAFVFLTLFSSAAFANDAMTNIMSPIVSYPCPEDLC